MKLKKPGIGGARSWFFILWVVCTTILFFLIVVQVFLNSLHNFLENPKSYAKKATQP